MHPEIAKVWAEEIMIKFDEGGSPHIAFAQAGFAGT